jgi:two-component system, NtrC family, sensor kinase
VDVNQTLERTLDLLRRQSLFFNIGIERHLADGLPPLRADPAQLQQVFMNIIMNAAQAMAEEGRLTVVTRAEPGGESVEIVITDTGHGIPHEDLDRIFDPFFTTGKEGHGTGLGLSIAYGIISKHQGTITVESTVGVGTTFTIRLPVAATFGATHPRLDELGSAEIPVPIASLGGPP